MIYGYCLKKTDIGHSWDLRVNTPYEDVHVRKPSTPGAPLAYFNDGGVQQRFIFDTPKKSQLQKLSTQKNPYFF